MRVAVFTNSQERILITDLAIVVVEVLSDSELEAETAAFGLGLGPFGGALDAALSTTPLVLSAKDVPELPQIRDVVHCASFEAPESLRTLPEWPNSGGMRPVTIYPKSLVSRASARWFGGIRLELAREAARIQDIGVMFWQVPGVRKALRAHGYPVAT